MVFRLLLMTAERQLFAHEGRSFRVCSYGQKAEEGCMKQGANEITGSEKLLSWLLDFFAKL